MEHQTRLVQVLQATEYHLTAPEAGAKKTTRSLGNSRELEEHETLLPIACLSHWLAQAAACGPVRGTNNSRDLDPLLSAAVPSGPTTDTCREIRFMSLALPRSLPKYKYVLVQVVFSFPFGNVRVFMLLLLYHLVAFINIGKCSI